MPCALRAGKLPFSRRRVARDRGDSFCRSAVGLPRQRTTEYRSTTPKMMAIAEVGTHGARNAPDQAPRVVAISRNMPMRILE